jgi:hypothetical protein
MGHMHENAARALQYYEDLPRRSGRPELRLVDDPRPPRPDRAEAAPTAAPARVEVRPRRARPAHDRRRAAAAPAPRPKPRSRTHVGAAPPAPRPRTPLRARRRQTVAPRIAGRPDRVAMWAVLLGFFLTFVAAFTGGQ